MKNDFKHIVDNYEKWGCENCLQWEKGKDSKFGECKQWHIKSLNNHYCKDFELKVT